MLLAQPLRQLHLGVFEFFALLRDGEVVGGKGEDGWLFGFKPGSVFLLVVGENGAEFLVNKGVVALLALGCLYCLHNPLLKLQVLCICSAIEPELKVLLALPKLLRAESEYLAAFLRNVLLVGIVVFGVVGFEVGGGAVVVEKELGEVVVLEGEL